MKPILSVPIITIDAFLKKEKFLKLREDFYRNDMECSKMDDVEFSKHLAGLKSIIPVRITFFNDKGEEFQYIFAADYLPVALNNLRQSYLKKVRADGKMIYGTDARLDFIIQKRNQILSCREEISKSNYLSDPEITEITLVLDDILDKLEEKKRNLTVKSAGKLQLNLKKQEVLFLLKIFFEVGLIKGSNLYEIMDFAERNFTYSGGIDIIDANKGLLKFLDRNPTKSYSEQTLTNFFKAHFKT